MTSADNLKLRKAILDQLSQNSTKFDRKASEEEAFIIALNFIQELDLLHVLLDCIKSKEITSSVETPTAPTSFVTSFPGFTKNPYIFAKVGFKKQLSVVEQVSCRDAIASIVLSHELPIKAIKSKRLQFALWCVWKTHNEIYLPFENIILSLHNMFTNEAVLKALVPHP